MNGADHCPSSLSQRLHEGNDLEARRAVQTAGMGHKRRQTTRETDALSNLDFCWHCADTQTRWIISYLVGSSKNMTGGLLTSSRAMASLLHWPPERQLVRVWAHSWRPRAVRISSTWDTNRHKCEYMTTHVDTIFFSWHVWPYIIILCCDVELWKFKRDLAAVEVNHDHVTSRAECCM